MTTGLVKLGLGERCFLHKGPQAKLQSHDKARAHNLKTQPTTTTRTSLTMCAPQKIWRAKAQQAQPTSIDTPAPTSKITRPPTQQEDKQDYWERQGEHWTRHRLVSRTTMFIPADGPGGHPPIDSLELYRTTITTNNFNEVKQHKDDWTTAGNTHLPYTGPAQHGSL